MKTIKLIFTTISLLLIMSHVQAAYLLVPMDNSQREHLKAYGIAYWALQNGIEIKWLLNYRGGSFLMPFYKDIETECQVRGVTSEVIADVQAGQILTEIASPEINMDAVKLEKAPRIAVYSPKGKQPWDDAVTLALTYAEIPYDIIYDEEVINREIFNYDWLHLHHEDFTGQYGKFYAAFHHMNWYQEEVRRNEAMAEKLGFSKVSELKYSVAKVIQEYVVNGGYMFAMCSAADSYDISLAAHKTDICEKMFDHDPADPAAQSKLDFSQTFAFRDFKLVTNPLQYEFSNIDVTETRKVKKDQDYFSLFDFSAKWDPVPSMLCQNHSKLIKGFMGQTTAFRKKLVKPNVLIMGENKPAGEARYIHGEFGKGTWTFLGGHDPEDYRHRVGEKPTELKLFPNSPGYRLILNNVLFPAAKKKKLKT
ncbi:MAG: asparagine synthetase B [Bacteroidota bacterium]|nr:asparagine synthetase B [Bacteroidota bacterium]